MSFTSFPASESAWEFAGAILGSSVIGGSIWDLCDFWVAMESASIYADFGRIAGARRRLAMLRQDQPFRSAIVVQPA
jgi:hypothetical protein